jgi:hypothetical protein
MATPAVATGARRQRTEEANALHGVVMALSATCGGMIAGFEALDRSVPFILLPTAGLLVGLARRSPPLTAWSALLVWALVLPMAPGVAILAPMLMGVVCLAFAIGPDRLIDWVHDEWIGRMGDEPVEVGWIEEDPSVR